MAYPPKAAFYEQYAEAAMKQQQMYGIPASITLAQMYIESAGGGSRLAEKGNNYFGIKCPPGWVDSGKPWGLHSDDKPNEKFCYYSSVEESIQHHSEFLMGKRYSSCRQLDSTDYRGWATGLKACGYATASGYAQSLIGDIETVVNTPSVVTSQLATSGYCFPLIGGNLVMSSGFGHRDAPTDGASKEHMGIDISVKKGDAVVSTETGVVVDVKTNMTEHDNMEVRKQKGNTGGNYVVVEYQRANGESYRVSYCHLTENGVAVKKGQSVQAGTVLGYAGSTGVSTGPHLHLTVRHGKDGVYGAPINPLNYLAEISARGNLNDTVVKKGTNADLLASLKPNADVTPTPADQILLAQQGQCHYG